MIEKYLNVIKVQVQRTTGTTCTQISVDSNENDFQVWATLYDSTTSIQFMVEFGIQKQYLTQYSDLHIMKQITQGLINDYLASLKDVATIH